VKRQPHREIRFAKEASLSSGKLLGEGEDRRPLVSVVVPGHNAESMLKVSLPSICAQNWPRDRLELVYVDDASTDQSINVAREWADCIMPLTGKPRGPSAARNAGVQRASGEIVVFFDADVVALPGTVRELVTALLEDNSLHAVFGSYDSEPSDKSLVSQYRNLLHHFVHQNSRRDASTFWAGCGAILKQSFLLAGGFDAVRYPQAMIEDIELGHRMRRLGMRIRLRPEVQVKHLKKWTIQGMLYSDLFCRGIPWMRLILMDQRASGEVGDLNLKSSAMLTTALACAGFLLVLLSPWHPKVIFIVCATLALGIMLNLPTYRFFYRARGLSFVLAVIPFHLFYHFYNVWSAVAGLFCHVLIDKPLPGLRALGAAMRERIEARRAGRG
jgi:hypothetical protein